MSASAPRTLSSNVSLAFGLFNVTVNVAGALEPPPKNVTVCTGDAAVPHDPEQIHTSIQCTTCGEVPRGSTHSAREVAGGLILLSPETHAAIGAEAEPFKKRIELAGHPSPQVEVETITGDKLYYLLPAPGQERAYAVMAALLGNHPEVAFCARWAPRSKVGMFRVTTRGDVLVMQERLPADRVKAAPAVPGEADEALLALAEKVLTQGRKTLVTRFEPAAYADTSQAAIADVVANGTPAQPSVDHTLEALRKMAEETKRRRPRKAAGETEAA